MAKQIMEKQRIARQKIFKKKTTIRCYNYMMDGDRNEDAIKKLFYCDDNIIIKYDEKLGDRSKGKVVGDS